MTGIVISSFVMNSIPNLRVSKKRAKTLRSPHPGYREPQQRQLVQTESRLPALTITSSREQSSAIQRGLDLSNNYSQRPFFPRRRASAIGPDFLGFGLQTTRKSAVGSANL